MKNRWQIIDVTKLFLIILVINLHIESFSQINNYSPFYYLGWFAVPLFVVISFYLNSSYFFTPWTKQNIFKKLSRYVYPLFFWSIIGFILKPDLITLKLVLRQILFGTAVNSPLYYLNLMILITLVIIAFQKFKKILIIFTLLILISEIFNGYSFLNSILPEQIRYFSIRFLELFKYAVLGIYLTKIKLKIPATIPLFFIAIFIGLQWITQTKNVGYTGLYQFILISLTAIFLKNYQNIRFPKLLTSMGKYTLGIYCLHSLFIENNIYSLPIIYILCLAISIILGTILPQKLKAIVM